MSKVLVAVEGDDQAGAASRFLIDRARTTRDQDFLIAGVQPLEARRVGARSDLVRRIGEAAGPWMDAVGIRYEMITRFGDVGDIVVEIARREACDEIIVVTRAEDSFELTLQRLLGLAPRNSAWRIASEGLPVTLVRPGCQPRNFYL